MKDSIVVRRKEVIRGRMWVLVSWKDSRQVREGWLRFVGWIGTGSSFTGKVSWVGVVGWT